MLSKFWKTTRNDAIRVCDRRGTVRDASCFAEEARERAFDQLVRQGWRLV